MSLPSKYNHARRIEAGAVASGCLAARVALYVTRIL